MVVVVVVVVVDVEVFAVIVVIVCVLVFRRRPFLIGNWGGTVVPYRHAWPPHVSGRWEMPGSQ